MIYTDIRVHAVCEEDLLSFLKLCTIIQGAGHKGSGRKIPIMVDGDGSGRYEFQLLKIDGSTENLPSRHDWPEDQVLWLGE